MKLALALLVVVGCLATIPCEDCELSIPELIIKQGYPVEHHEVTTQDGFQLGMLRIPRGRSDRLEVGHRPAVLLQHGLLDSCATWVLNMPNQSLGYILADAGFDVWMGNNRGNSYSRPTCETIECWNFSFDEMGLYDLPANIDYILDITGLESIGYVGHSEGTIQGFAGFSMLPELESKVNVFIALAPVAYVDHQSSTFVKIMTALHFDTTLAFFGAKEFMAKSWFVKKLGQAFCDGGWLTSSCENVIFALTGKNPERSHNFNASRIDVYSAHTPAGTSTQNMVHWGQLIRNGNFGMFDYGSAKNLEKYGQSTAPDFDLGKVKVPTALFSGGYDDLADKEDFYRLVSELPRSSIIYQNYQEHYAHLDFVWGMDCNEKIYPHVTRLLREYSPNAVTK